MGKSKLIYYMRHNALVTFGFAILALLVIASLLAPWLAPYPQDAHGAVHTERAFLPPSGAHLFGTDALGRDLFSLVLYGGRISLSAGFIAIVVSVAAGALIGLIAGYVGGWIDEMLMRFTDIVLSFPPLLLAVSIASLLGPSLSHALLAIMLSWWPWYTRLIRSQIVQLRSAGYVESAIVSGKGAGAIMRRHILPNSLSPVIVQASMDFGSIILTLAGLSFLGMGAQPPSTEWGLLVSQGKTYVLSNWWYAAFPGLPILLTAVALNLAGDGLRDLLDPRQKGVTR